MILTENKTIDSLLCLFLGHIPNAIKTAMRTISQKGNRESLGVKTINSTCVRCMKSIYLVEGYVWRRAKGEQI